MSVEINHKTNPKECCTVQKKKVIAYVSTKDLPMMQENDIKMLDVINLAFGHN